MEHCEVPGCDVCEHTPPDTCEFCGALPCDHAKSAGWRAIETLPCDRWVYVFVPGTGPGFAARKVAQNDEDGRPVIVGLSNGKRIWQATHWRGCWEPPTDSYLSEKNLYERDL